ncbi:MAG: dnaE, partial [Hyphomicrobiales bacterium]|nr:dnaE [Hyphomicrobiales bacterium]
MSYAELAVATNFSFLRGASHPEEIVAQAQELGLAGVGIADRNSVAGVVRAHVYARETNASVRVIAGARLVFCDGAPDIVAYPQDRAAWGRLCRLLTRGNLRARKGDCILFFEDLADWREGLQFIVLEESTWTGDKPPAKSAPNVLHFPGAGAARTRDPGAGDAKSADKAPEPRVASHPGAWSQTPSSHVIPKRLADLAPGRVWIGARLVHDARMRESLAGRVRLARELRLPLIAVNDVLMHDPARRDLADALACIREGVGIEQAGVRVLHANAERHLKPAHEMRRLFAEAPGAVDETLRFLEGVRFSLDQLRYEYPDELREGYSSEQEALEAFAWAGAKNRYPEGVPDTVATAIKYELAIVAELGYAAYFLTVHDIVRFARTRGILCQGRGSAANSVVCFCLGVTEVDPTKHDLLFERFISAERREPPDIDVDFEHERREEVMQYIYNRYGRERAGLTAAVISYRGRSALREVGKVFGFDDTRLGAMTKTVWGSAEEAGE